MFAFFSFFAFCRGMESKGSEKSKGCASNGKALRLVTGENAKNAKNARLERGMKG